MNELFIIEGRLNRKAFLGYLITLIIIYYITFKLCEILYNINEHSGLVMCSLLWGVLTYILLIIHIKRLHDINVTGWCVLLLFILGPILTAALLNVPGTKAANRFGDPNI